MAFSELIAGVVALAALLTAMHVCSRYLESHKETFVATPKTASLAGAGSALMGCLLGPYVDHSKGVLGTVVLALATATVAIPAYFFVFGLTRDQLVGFWVARPDLLKRIGAWFLGAMSVAALFQIVLLVVSV